MPVGEGRGGNMLLASRRGGWVRNPLEAGRGSPIAPIAALGELASQAPL